MIEAFQIMKWPLLACLLLPGLLVYLGLHIVEREIIFVDLALAQVAALGTCVAILLGHDAHDWQTYAWAASFTVIGAGIFTVTKTKTHRVPQEALIGIVYVVAAALGILLLSRSAEGNEELRRTLVGEVLLVRPVEVWKTFALYAVIAVVHFVFRRQFLALTLGKELPRAARWWDFLFYALFGFVVTSFVQIGGVLLVFSYLIIPAVCGKFLADSLPVRLLIGWVVATLGSVVGLWASYAGDWPTGAAVVCALGLALLLVGASSVFVTRRG
jgi:zinc/manganese transport system permease protein